MKKKNDMLEKIKELGYGTLGIGLFGLFIVAIALLAIGGVKLFEILYPLLESVSSITWSIVWLLLLLSIVPRFRDLTGSGIVLGTYIGGTIFWLLCFYITYQLWGFLGIFVGVISFGLGVFFTAVLALLFDGQFMAALWFIFVLAQIFLFRHLGYWIIGKYREKTDIYANAAVSDNKLSITPSHCGQCGFKLDSDSNFCQECGVEIK